jgi:hypothetical protein
MGCAAADAASPLRGVPLLLLPAPYGVCRCGCFQPLMGCAAAAAASPLRGVLLLLLPSVPCRLKLSEGCPPHPAPHPLYCCYQVKRRTATMKPFCPQTTNGPGRLGTLTWHAVSATRCRRGWSCTRCLTAVTLELFWTCRTSSIIAGNRERHSGGATTCEGQLVSGLGAAAPCSSSSTLPNSATAAAAAMVNGLVQVPVCCGRVV